MTSVDNLESLDNKSLRAKCLEYGLPDVPVTNTSKKLLIKKLRIAMEKKEKETKVGNQSTPTKSKTPTQRRRSSRNTPVSTPEKTSESLKRKSVVFEKHEESDDDIIIVENSSPPSAKRRTSRSPSLSKSPVVTTSFTHDTNLDSIIEDEDEEDGNVQHKEYIIWPKNTPTKNNDNHTESFTYTTNNNSADRIIHQESRDDHSKTVTHTPRSTIYNETSDYFRCTIKGNKNPGSRISEYMKKMENFDRDLPVREEVSGNKNPGSRISEYMKKMENFDRDLPVREEVSTSTSSPFLSNFARQLSRYNGNPPSTNSTLIGGRRSLSRRS